MTDLSSGRSSNSRISSDVFADRPASVLDPEALAKSRFAVTSAWYGNATQHVAVAETLMDKASETAPGADGTGQCFVVQ